MIGFWKTSEKYGAFSNWYPCIIRMDGLTFSSSEQIFMYKKAEFFGDTENMENILKTKSPMMAKKYGRLVKNFDSLKFEEKRYQFMFEAVLSKFTQNEEMRELLLGTGDEILVEASPKDNIWGIGMEASDPDFNDMSKWKGRNLLGKVLMDVRKTLKEI